MTDILKSGKLFAGRDFGQAFREIILDFHESVEDQRGRNHSSLRYCVILLDKVFNGR